MKRECVGKRAERFVGMTDEFGLFVNDGEIDRHGLDRIALSVNVAEHVTTCHCKRAVCHK